MCALLTPRDLERTDAPLYTVSAHEGIVNTIDGCGGRVGYGAPELVTGGADGLRTQTGEGGGREGREG